MDEFKEMEANGELLESGIFGDNYYGTPKPPKDPKKLNVSSRVTSQDDRSSISSFRKDHSMIDGAPSRPQHQPVSGRDSLGPLPSNWEIAYTEQNEKYYIE